MDRRSAKRQQSETWGHIVCDDGARSLLCAVMDESDVGARLKISGGATTVPSTFNLVRRGDNTPLSCRRVWATGNELGVWFSR